MSASFEIQMDKGAIGLVTDNYEESEFITKPGSALDILGAKVYNNKGKPLLKIFAKLIQD